MRAGLLLRLGERRLDGGLLVLVDGPNLAPTFHGSGRLLPERQNTHATALATICNAGQVLTVDLIEPETAAAMLRTPIAKPRRMRLT